jgi:hypothetical protein
MRTFITLFTTLVYNDGVSTRCINKCTRRARLRGNLYFLCSHPPPVTSVYNTRANVRAFKLHNRHSARANRNYLSRNVQTTVSIQYNELNQRLCYSLTLSLSLSPCNYPQRVPFINIPVFFSFFLSSLFFFFRKHLPYLQRIRCRPTRAR